MSEQSIGQQVLTQISQGERELGKLAKAYVAAWRDVGVGVLKDATNPHLGNEYATLEAHLNQIKPIFARHGLAILQSPGPVVDGKLTIETMLIHESGQHVMITTHVPLVADKHGNVTAQIMGSATTYGCRYVLRGLGGLAATDDDGNVASTAPAAPKRAAKVEAAESENSHEADALIAEIKVFAGTVVELEERLKPRVKDLGDKNVNEAYLAKRAAMKAAAKEGK